ncbi:MAG: hypothetical protein ACJ75J_01920 [Cytophagaceae bacterium]
MSKVEIHIPKPCHENWNAMVPSGEGRHCCSCAKTVVDFTVMSDDEVKEYFRKNRGENTCGHFKASQTSNPQSLLHRLLNTAYEFLEERPRINFFRPACLLFLGLCMMLAGCHRHVKGKRMYPRNPDIKSSQQEILMDDSHRLMGKVAKPKK